MSKNEVINELKRQEQQAIERFESASPGSLSRAVACAEIGAYSLALVWVQKLDQ